MWTQIDALMYSATVGWKSGGRGSHRSTIVWVEGCVFLRGAEIRHNFQSRIVKARQQMDQAAEGNEGKEGERGRSRGEWGRRGSAGEISEMLQRSADSWVALTPIQPHKSQRERDFGEHLLKSLSVHWVFHSVSCYSQHKLVYTCPLLFFIQQAFIESKNHPILCLCPFWILQRNW